MATALQCIGRTRRALSRVTPPADRKRWPCVVAPLSTPMTSARHDTVSPCSDDQPCTGRTNSASPAPQRITFGIGNARSAVTDLRLRRSPRARCLASSCAGRIRPFGVSRCSSASGATPFFGELRQCGVSACPARRGRPLSTAPRARSICPALTSRTFVIVTARRRGVANQRLSLPATEESLLRERLRRACPQTPPSVLAPSGAALRSAARRAAYASTGLSRSRLPYRDEPCLASQAAPAVHACTSGSPVLRANRSTPARPASRAPRTRPM